MAVNVWEWCLTEWESGSQALTTAGMKLLRGGSWDDDAEDARATVRYELNRP